jgi:transcriptional regulator with XRE-family HTH domain
MGWRMKLDEKTRDVIRRRLKELGISRREASRRLGRNMGYVDDILSGRSENPDAEEVFRLIELLDMDSEEVLGESRPVTAADMPRRGENLPLGTVPGVRMIPLYSAPLPLMRQFVPFSTEPTGRIPSPHMVRDTPGAFAAMVPNNASAPRFFAGELIVVNPAAAPAPGDFVWVQRNDETVAIARLKDMSANSFILEFLGLEGDSRTAEVAYSEVKAINRIVATTTM